MSRSDQIPRAEGGFNLVVDDVEYDRIQKQRQERCDERGHVPLVVNGAARCAHCLEELG